MSALGYHANVIERKRTPFSHLQFMAQTVPTPQLVTMIRKATDKGLKHGRRSRGNRGTRIWNGGR